MRLGLWALAALFFGAFVAHFLLADRGYVLIEVRGYAVEMSIPALVLALALGYATVRGVRRIWRAPRALGAALAGRSDRKSGDRLTQGLMYLADGDWSRGERLLTQSLTGSTAPLVNYLMAARAAERQGARERRNEWLKLACEALPEAEVAILLTQAELQFDAGELEAALATLKRLRDKAPEHDAGLALHARVLLALGDRAALLDLLPQLRQSRLPAPELAGIVGAALEGIGAPADLGLDAYTGLWAALPRAVCETPAVLRAHARVLDRLGAGEQAVKELGAALKRGWDDELVRAYGEVKGAEPLKQLRKAEDWLKEHADDATLLLTAGRLSIVNELWGKARSYLESSLALAPSADTYAEFGALLERLGEREQAALAYHSGLRLAQGSPGTLLALAPPRSRLSA